MNRFSLLAACIICLVRVTEAQNDIYLDRSQSLDTRVKDLISRLTLEEKVYQMMNNSPAIPGCIYLPITGGMRRFMAWPVPG